MDWLLEPFVTRNHCGPWTDDMILLYQCANLFIFLAYFTIPISFFELWRKTNGIIKSRWMILCVAAFIFSCGITHLCDAISFHWAPYRLFTLIDIITACLSVATALLLPQVLKSVISEREA